MSAPPTRQTWRLISNTDRAKHSIINAAPLTDGLWSDKLYPGALYILSTYAQMTAGYSLIFVLYI